MENKNTLQSQVNFFLKFIVAAIESVTKYNLYATIARVNVDRKIDWTKLLSSKDEILLSFFIDQTVFKFTYLQTIWTFTFSSLIQKKSGHFRSCNGNFRNWSPAVICLRLSFDQYDRCNGMSALGKYIHLTKICKHIPTFFEIMMIHSARLLTSSQWLIKSIYTMRTNKEVHILPHCFNFRTFLKLNSCGK